MTEITNIAAAEQILAEYMLQVRELLGKDLTLVRMKPLMNVLGNPQKSLNIIHVAGTSGKTSTTYYIASLLKTAGKKVGHTVSPHVDSITERLQVGLEPVPENIFCQAFGEFMDLIVDVDPKPTYFELIIAFVYWYFAKIQVDYAVIETGLGGSFDATNVADGPGKVCVLTDIGLDHTHVLGDTLSEITGQKAGIIHSGNRVFMHEQSTAVIHKVQAITNTQQAKLNVLSNYQELSREMQIPEFVALPQYQKRNWLLAYKTYEYLASRDSLPALGDQQLAKSMQIQVPGRMDMQKYQGKTVIMDGAHNEQKITAFVHSFQKLFPAQKVPILLALKTGKEYQAVLPLLKPICSQLIITTFAAAQDLPAKSIQPEILVTAASQFGFENVLLEADCKIAFDRLVDQDGENVIIVGSFYLLSNLRPFIIT